MQSADLPLNHLVMSSSYLISGLGSCWATTIAASESGALAYTGGELSEAEGNRSQAICLFL
ncbi:hypothetical protein AG1IA_09886 [Rhizoctonia solani AG-1 IA]|uniref:Uncharacterized protein n=1 Tax=Thanatephorus cucumeris (strain AG1-IA) TaxID=983506 RepID=L8WH26_THACA|nr:hypothetical protein AG1IA_09886 [Rhizoctonia solani AG-1 IA]